MIIEMMASLLGNINFFFQFRQCGLINKGQFLSGWMVITNRVDI